jgi:hypothetical protein
MAEPQPPVLQVASPFNRPDANVVFRASDGVEFRLHKQTLIMSSAVLEKMIEDLADAETTSSTIQTLDVPESSDVLDSLFRYCYPVVEPKPKTLEEVRDVLDAATKYDILAAREPLEEHLAAYVSTMPVRVYAIARKNDLNSIAHQAAQVVIEGSFLASDYPELRSMPADVYWNLITCFRNSKSPPRVIRTKKLWKPHITKKQSTGCVLMWKSISGAPSELPETSWATLPFDGFGNDVVIRSSDAVQFRLHKWILSFASPFFRQMFSLPQADTDSQELPAIPVSESGEVLEYLLALIYPAVHEPDPPSLGVIYETLAAATKYEMERPIAIMKNVLNNLVTKAPVSVFLIACHHALDTIAADAARCAMQKPLLDHASDGLEVVEESIDPRIDVKADVVYRLIQYRSMYLHAVDAMDWKVVSSTDAKWRDVNQALKVSCLGSHASTSRRRTESTTTCKSIWLENYGPSAKIVLKKGSSMLKALPHWQADDLVLLQALARVGECENCRYRAPGILCAYRRMILEHVDTKIREVSTSEFFRFLF